MRSFSPMNSPNIVRQTAFRNWYPCSQTPRLISTPSSRGSAVRISQPFLQGRESRRRSGTQKNNRSKIVARAEAERKHRLLVIALANLRKQWGQELASKFILPFAILKTRTFNESIGAGNLNPFQQDAVILCSYQFARSKEPYLRQTP
jgi:hypothetical protein